jgi:hypothetical protein
VATPFALVLVLGGVVTAAIADRRIKLGVRYGWRTLSAASPTEFMRAR